jgi:hypothetical protein
MMPAPAVPAVLATPGWRTVVDRSNGDDPRGATTRYTLQDHEPRR